MRILLADDSRALRLVYRKVFEKLGHAPPDLLDAVDGAAVREILGDPRAELDLILADGDLPGLDGHSLLKLLAARKPPLKVPVVLCVAGHQRAFAQEALRLGARGLIVRPFSEEEIREKLTLLEACIRAQQAEEARSTLKAALATGRGEAGLPFLLQLPSAMMADLLALAWPFHAAEGAALLCRGETVDRLHVITRGEAEVYDDAVPRLPRTLGMGETYGEIAFLAGRRATYSVRALTALEGVSLDRPRLADLLRRQPGLAPFLNTLGAPPSTSGGRPPLVGSDFFGSLQSMAFADLVRLLNLSRKCGRLEIGGADATGEIHFDAGEVVHARLGLRSGEEVFHEIAAWTDATFTFRSGRRVGERSIGHTTQALLAESRRRAERGKSRSVSA